MKIIPGRITSGFGKRIHPLTQVEKFHNGVDVAVPIGTAVLSPVDGIIHEIYTHATGGLTLILGDKTGRRRFGFCHLSKTFFPAGTPVTQGSIIALSGNTGASTGPHVHFTAKEGGQWEHGRYVGGTWVDPTQFLEL